jgi:hypothetical protein
VAEISLLLAAGPNLAMGIEERRSGVGEVLVANVQLKDDLKSAYSIYRQYAEHEDSLINSRLSWNLTVQGFLLAAFGIVALKLIDTCGTGPVDSRLYLLKLVVFVLPLAGLAVSVVSAIGVLAAALALDKLDSDWEDKVKLELWKLDRDGEYVLPRLTGGGSDRAHNLGLYPARIIPWVFVVAWFAFLCGSIYLVAAGCQNEGSPSGAPEYSQVLMEGLINNTNLS